MDGSARSIPETIITPAWTDWSDGEIAFILPGGMLAIMAIAVALTVETEKQNRYGPSCTLVFVMVW